ncbi:MAG TPA: SoxY-related AACIE arm protein [Burkholderiales bacterium]|nr:SoxY-related AACIE arm protein [Burkholderiales bacterium]
MTSRRNFLIAAAGGIGLATRARPARATPAAMQDAVRKVTGGAALRSGRVKLDVPPLIDNGNSVPLSVAVESPMTPSDHVKAIHVFTERNPLPNVLSVRLGPRAGRARITTRVRLADSGSVLAIAELSDGSYWTDSVQVVVTLSACLEEAQV